MSLQLKLKNSAIEVLIGLLQPKEMIAIYLLGIGKTEPQKFDNHDLIKIIIVLCEQLCWIEDEISGGDDYSENIPLSEADTEPAISTQKVESQSVKKWPMGSHPDPSSPVNIKHLQSQRTQESPTENFKSRQKYDSQKKVTNIQKSKSISHGTGEHFERCLEVKLDNCKNLLKPAISYPDSEKPEELDGEKLNSIQESQTNHFIQEFNFGKRLEVQLEDCKPLLKRKDQSKKPAENCDGSQAKAKRNKSMVDERIESIPRNTGEKSQSKSNKEEQSLNRLFQELPQNVKVEPDIKDVCFVEDTSYQDNSMPSNQYDKQLAPISQPVNGQKIKEGTF